MNPKIVLHNFLDSFEFVRFQEGKNKVVYIVGFFRGERHGKVFFVL